MGKYKLLHVIPRLPVGGAERLLASVLPLLPKERFESIVCCIQDKGAIAEQIEASGYEVVCLDRMREHGFDRQAVSALTRLIHDRGIDLVHTHLYHANLYGRLAALAAKVPAVATVHNSYVRTKLHRRLLNAYLGYRTERVIAVSEQVANDVLKYDFLPPRKVTLLPNGIDLRPYAHVRDNRSATRAKLGFSSQDLLIVVVGRLEEQKGHRFLLQAFAQMQAAGKAANTHILLAGDGRLRDSLKAQAFSSGIADFVHFLGMRQDIPDILGACDIFAMPSLWEGMSLALLEGMAAGLPILATDVGAARQVLCDGDGLTGVLVEPGDVSAIEEGLSRLLASEALRGDFATRGARTAAERYSVQGLADRLSALYLEILEKNNG